MNVLKQLGIFMDHTHAHLMEYHHHSVSCQSLDKHSISHGDHHGSAHAEIRLQTKEKTEQQLFYKKLGAIIQQYDKVLLFGPTEAKKELLHMLRADQHFSGIEIELKDSDRLTENQQHAFVIAHFK